MRLPKNTETILIAKPDWNVDLAWMRQAIHVAGIIDLLMNDDDPEFAGRVVEWPDINCDVVVEAYNMAAEFKSKNGPAVIPADTMLGDVFSILAGSGLFKYISPYYHFTIPELISPDIVREAVYRLLNTADADGLYHSEMFLPCTLSQHLPPEISLLEKARDTLIYRVPTLVISPLEM